MKKQKQMPGFRFHQDRRSWRLFACAALASLGCAFSPVHAASPAAESIKLSDPDAKVRVDLEGATLRAWKAGDFAKLEALYAAHRELSSRSPSGKPMVAIFGGALRNSIVYPGPYADRNLGDHACNCGPHPDRYAEVDRQWDLVGAKIDRWAKAHPKSSLALIAKVDYLIARGHFYRGTQLVKGVRPEAWPILRKNLTLAQDALSDAHALEKNPLWYDRALTLLGAQSAPKEFSLGVINLMVKDGMAHAEPFIDAMVFMQPKWGGSLEQMEALAQIADSATAKTDFGATYARVYWGFATSREPALLFSFFKSTQASWPAMRKSFDALVRQYPASRNYSGYAIFACVANDIELSKSLLKKAGTLQYFEQSMGPAFPECRPE